MNRSINIGIAIILALTSLPCLAGSEPYIGRIYLDAVLHALHGHVRRCVTTSSKNDSRTVLEFRADGTEVLAGNIRREWRWGGVPFMDIDTLVLPFLSSGPDTTFYSIQEDAIYKKGLSSTIDYLNDNGDIVRSESVVLLLGQITYSYNILEKDSMGNWTRREVRDEDGQLVCCEQRALTYWTEEDIKAAEVNVNADVTGSTEPEAPAVETFVEPDRELSIDDIMYRPLGVVEPVDGNPWNLHFSDIGDAVRRRSNWEWQDYFSDGVIVYGNDNYGEKKPVGYNLTYRGEPVFSVSAQRGLRDALQCYEISFERGIAGKVPSALKYEAKRLLSRPQWTEKEAIAFADAMAMELASKGIRLSRIKSGEGHLYVMQGSDDLSAYKIDVYRHIDKYSAFYMVSLTVSPMIERGM